jgi:hypothetical protein
MGVTPPILVDEPPPPEGTEESVEGAELPDGEYDDDGDDGWDDPDDEMPVLKGRR